ncbi:MAG: hypothetical protein LBG72_02260 [Spirochaetaceae bacterium]|jgi:flagellar biosynthesis protein FlhF|nr:hypothetical protein [Spirochaetaceae bacterium]
MNEFAPFTIERPTLEQCKQRARELYGDRITVMQEGEKLTDGIFGFFKKNVWYIKGYVPPQIDMSKYAFGIYNTPKQTETAPVNSILTEKDKVLEAAAERTGTDPKLTQILAGIEAINEKIDSKQNVAIQNEHENVLHVETLLEQNDVLPSFRKKMLSRIKKEVPFDTLNNGEELEQRVLEWMGDEISIYTEEKHTRLPRIIVLVGPTGVGKTTTIAKLATRFSFGKNYGLDRDFSTGLITIDMFRMGAEIQLRKYTDILKIPLETAIEKSELKRKLTLMSENAEVIIIDTIGRSPRDSKELADMKSILEACGTRAEYFLTVSASTKALDLVSIMKQFEIFAYRAVIVTKLDETQRAGNVISVLAELGKPLAFLTDGQTATPEYLVKAHPVRLLINLDGFEPNRDRLEKHFGAN